MSFDSSLVQTVQTLQALTQIRAEIDRAGELILDTLRNGRKLLICGNGGSAAEASHFSTELTGRYFKDRRACPRSHSARTAHLRRASATITVLTTCSRGRSPASPNRATW